MFGFKNKNDNERKLNVIIVGPTGMLGHELYDFLTEDAHSKHGSRIGKIKPVWHSEIDATDFHDFAWYFSDLVNSNTKWDYVVNCAAFTETLSCEEWNNREKSYKVNALIPKNLARICHAHGIKLIHVSTNEVFSNSLSNKCSNDTPNPTSVYGMHKYLGELFIKENMDEGEYAILRTSWLYGMHNSKSFIHKCVKTFVNHERNDSELFGIDEEISIPTDVSYLSELILNAMKRGIHGIFNAINSGEPMSRLDYMKLILLNLHELGEFKDINPNDIRNLTYDECPALRKIGRVVLESDDTEPLRIFSSVECRDQLRKFLRKNGLEIVKWARGEHV